MNTTKELGYTLLDFINMKDFDAITLGDKVIENKLIELANEHESKVVGLQETRKHVIKEDFRLGDMETAIECMKVVHEQPETIDSVKDVAKNYLERAFRCEIPSGAVKDASSIVAKLLEKNSVAELAQKVMRYVQEKIDTVSGFVFAKELSKWGVA